MNMLDLTYLENVHVVGVVVNVIISVDTFNVRLDLLLLLLTLPNEE